MSAPRPSSHEIPGVIGWLLDCARNQPITPITRELGLSDTSIHQWRKELAQHGKEVNSCLLCYTYFKG